MGFLILIVGPVTVVLGLLWLVTRSPMAIKSEAKTDAYNAGLAYGDMSARGFYMPPDLKHYYKNDYKNPKYREAYDAAFAKGIKKGTAKRQQIEVNRTAFTNA